MATGTSVSEAANLRLVRQRLSRALGRHLSTLHTHNTQLWELEDRVRSTTSVRTIAKLKREIDAANLARHGAIAAIDAHVVTTSCGVSCCAPDATDAVIDSSSVGQLLDRLSILALKQARVIDPAARTLATAQWNHLLVCLDRILSAIVAGRWVHHPVGEVKQYGSPAARAPRLTPRATARRGSRRTARA